MTSRRVPAKTLVKQEQALKLYIAGQPYDQIAKAVGYSSRSAAANAVTAALKRHNAEREDLVDEAMTIAMGRYEALFRIAFRKAVDGDIQAVVAARQVVDRMVRVQGLEAPTQIQASLQVRSELDAQIEELMSDLGGSPDRVTDGSR